VTTEIDVTTRLNEAMLIAAIVTRLVMACQTLTAFRPAISGRNELRLAELCTRDACCSYVNNDKEPMRNVY